MPARLAVFWDFTQLHQSLLHLTNGGQGSDSLLTSPQPEVVDVACLLRSLDNTGRIVFARAYADWRHLGSYGAALSEVPMDLTQLFPNKLGNLPIHRRLTTDVMDYLATPNPAETIVIVGGGSEYRQLRQTIHSKGGRLMGVGIEEGSDGFWIESCDEYRFYHRMGCEKLYVGDFAPATLDHERSRTLLVDALHQLSNYYGTDWIQQVRIKPAIIRQHPDFDEGQLGYEAFSHFLRDQGDLLERRHREGEQEPEYRLTGSAAASPDTGREPAPEQLASQYLRVAGQQGIRMPDPIIMWEGIDVYAGFLADEISFASFSEIDQECLRLLREDFPQLSMTEVKKVRQVLFKCFLFRPSVDDTIGFHDEVTGLEDIENRYFQLMLARIGNNIDEPLDYQALSLALTGGIEQTERLASTDARLEEE